MARCNVCYQLFTRKSDLTRHVRAGSKCAAKPDQLAELTTAVARLAERVDRQDLEIQDLKRGRTGIFPQYAPLVFAERDLLTLVVEGLHAFAQPHKWPVLMVGKAVYYCDGGAWAPMTEENLDRLAGDVMKQLSALLTKYVADRGMLYSDADGRYLEYTLKVYEMRPSQLKKAVLSVCDRV